MECGADLTAMNLSDHNPLQEAIGYGNREVITAILVSDRWKEAVRSVKMTSSGVKETPVKQLIKRFPDLAKESLDNFQSSPKSSQVRGCILFVFYSDCV